MSARRAARSAAVTTTADGVPHALTDPDDHLWRSREAVEALARSYGLPYTEPQPSPYKDPYWQRFEAVRLEYCRALGLMQSAHHIDYRRAAAAGIAAYSRGPRFFTAPDGTVVPRPRPWCEPGSV